MGVVKSPSAQVEETPSSQASKTRGIVRTPSSSSSRGRSPRQTLRIEGPVAGARSTLRRRNASRARNRALASGSAIFTGEDGLEEVAKDDGAWDWVLLGPDPQRLPLAGGGGNSIEEMRGVFGKHAQCYGLLRMTFGVENPEIKFIHIVASDDIDSGNFSAVERGKAASLGPKMEEAIRKYAAFSAKIHLQSPDECTEENIVERLRDVVRGVDAKVLTIENFRAAVAAHKAVVKAANPEVVKQEKEAVKKKQFLLTVEAPALSIAEPEHDAAPTEQQQEPTRQRKALKLPDKGDVVEVYSMKHGKWFLDGEILEVAKETTIMEGYQIPAGSMKVVYDNGMRFKWVGVAEMEQFIRPSNRPRPPDPLTGELNKETFWLFLARWSKVYCEMHKGFLQWWNSKEDAKRRQKPAGSVYLLGLQLQADGAMFKLRSDGSQGAVFTFMGESEEEAQSWIDALWLQAEYCNEMLEFSQAKQGGQDVRKQLLESMMQKEFMSRISQSALKPLA